MEIQLIQLQLVQEELQDLMEILVVKEIVHQLLVLHQKEVVLVVVIMLSVDLEDQVVVEPYQLELVVVELHVKETMVELVVQIQEDQDQEQIMVLELAVELLQLELMEQVDLTQDQQEVEQEELDLQLLLLLDVPLNLFILQILHVEELLHVEFLLVVAVVETDIIMVPLKQEVLVVAEKVDYLVLQV